MATIEHEAELLLEGLGEATVLAAMSPQLPEALVCAVLAAARRHDVRITLVAADLTGRWDFLDDATLDDVAADRLRLVALAGGVPRHLADLIERIPMSLWDADQLIAAGQLPVDVFLARVGTGAGPRQLTYGDMIGYSASALGVAERVGFEVVEHPHVHPGTAAISADRADLITRGEPVTPRPPAPTVPTPEQRAVARRVAGLVPNGATLQLGVGGVPAATAEALDDKHDLGLHSGVLPAPTQGLISSGVVTGARKSHQQGQHVATGLLGGDPDAWGAQVLLAPISETHDPAMLLTQENLWAINSAFEIDLAGQVNAEYAGEARVASGAGQIDFARAAHACPGGGSVLALPARTRRGASRIVARTSHPVTTSGNDVDYVVTEFGVARLHGLTTGERRQALIEVAHPEDRPSLRAASAS